MIKMKKKQISKLWGDILNHKYKTKSKIAKFFRKYITQRKWFHYLYHRLFGHRIIENTGYAWCEYCDYHQERFEERLYSAGRI